MKKLNQLMLKIDVEIIEEKTKPNSGQFHISKILKELNSEPRVLIQRLTWLSMKYSCSDLSFQCKELLNVSVQTMLSSRNTIRTEKPRNGNLIQNQRPLTTITGLLILCQWKEPTLDAEPKTQDGSNSSSGELHTLETESKKNM